MKLASLLLTVIWYVISVSAFAQSAKTPLPDWLAPFFNGKPFDNEFRAPNGPVKLEVTFKPDGSAKIDGPRGDATGSWTYESGRHCVTWTSKYESSCGTLVKEADGSIKRTRESTGDVNIWRLR